MPEGTSRYVMDPASGVLLREGFKGIAYSDGADFEHDLLQVITAATDLSSGSPELAAAIVDWRWEAHLSPARANLLRPFRLARGLRILELGAGCGGLTRFLAETGASVDAVEGSHARASCAAARVRDLANASVYCDDLATFDTTRRYDVVTLVGVLEYARLFTQGDDPVGTCLGRARALLRDGGVLIVAIENQLGLKYLNGCHEDHVGTRFAGVTDLYGDRTAVTFGKRELGEHLLDAGFAGVDWYYPFPDYKVPSVVVADRALECADLALGDLLFGESARDYTGSALRSFDEGSVWPVLHRNGLVGDLANSFLAVARSGRKNVADPGGRWLARKYSASRMPRYATETSFALEDGHVVVTKSELYPGLGDGAAPVVAIEHRVGTATYVPGRLFARHIADAVGRADNLEDVAAAFAPWLSFLLAQAYATQGSATPWSHLMVSGELLDCVPFNLIVDRDGKLQPIDLEFAVPHEIPLPWVVLRGVVHTASRCFGQRALAELRCGELLHAVVRHLGLADVADWDRFCDLEDQLILAVLLPWPGRKSAGLMLERLANPATITLAAYDLLERRERQVTAARQTIDDLLAWLASAAARAAGDRGEIIPEPLRARREVTGIIARLAAVWPRPAGTDDATHALWILADALDDSAQRVFANARLTDDLAQRGRRSHYLEQELARAQQALTGLTESLGVAQSERQALESAFMVALERQANAHLNHVGQLESAISTATNEALHARRLQESADADRARQAEAHSVHVMQLERAVAAATSEALETSRALRTTETSLIRHQHDLARRNEQRDAAIDGLLREQAERATERRGYRMHVSQLERAVTAAAAEASASGELLRTAQTNLVRHEDDVTELRGRLEAADHAAMTARERLASVTRQLESVEATSWFRLMRRVDGIHATTQRAALTSRQAMTHGVFRTGRLLYRSLPVPADARGRAKDAFYRRFGRFFKNTLNYQVWQAERATWRSPSPPTPPPALPAASDAPPTQPLGGDHAGPTLTVIIPAYGHAELTRTCVASVAASRSGVPMEVIVVDDGSTVPLAESIAADAYVRVVRNDQNLGFIGACNRGGAEARGTHLLFLNNDAQLCAGAIDAMLQSFEVHADAGIVGCKLVFPDGRLQEAGAYVRPDGTAEMVGLWEDPDKPQYGFEREVGYTSGACLMIPRRIFVELGGFDPAFAPAYCEDSDLCYRVRKAGYKVYYQPRAVVEHALSASMQDAPIDKATVIAANQEAFVQRWGATLRTDDAVRAIAFYLPQYHPIPENDRWWGKGFTEWTNVARARPLFPGHHQPNIPADLGFYDLRLPDVRREQADLARAAGIHGFCYYYYWFAGARLLSNPLDRMIESGDPDFPFCVCWANENWTRRWDGLDSDILIAQHYSPEDDIAFLDSLLPALRDRRYIRIDGRPLLLVYRPSLLPDAGATTARWRERARAAGIGEIYLAAVQSFFHVEGSAPDAFGFDAAVEFPPHSLAVLSDRQPKGFPGQRFEGNAYDYRRTADNFVSREPPAYKLFRAVMPRWDNTARRGTASNVFIDGGTEAYRSWLQRAADYTRRMYFGDERLLFINAWNEWGEGNYLEPDRQHGHAYLDATRAVLGDG
ncbi:MAG: glycoside hydrolase family 99-like domain-containing protein [Casimicrobiaceae bacterium]